MVVHERGERTAVRRAATIPLVRGNNGPADDSRTTALRYPPERWVIRPSIAGPPTWAYTRRMPRMQVYLPDDLYQVLKSRRLPASELLQRAVRSELRRLDLLAETNRYLEGLVARVGAPSARDRQRASAIANRAVPRPKRRAG